MKKLICLIMLLPVVFLFSACGEADIGDVVGEWAYEGNENWIYTFDKDLSFSERHEYSSGDENSPVFSSSGSFQILSGILILKKNSAFGESTERYKVEVDGGEMTLTDDNGDKTVFTKL